MWKIPSMNAAVALLSTDAVSVVLAVQKLSSSKVVTLDTSRDSREVLSAVGRGSPSCCARDLSEEDVECLSSSCTAVSELHSCCIGGVSTKLSIHVITSVGATNGRRVITGLSFHS